MANVNCHKVGVNRGPIDYASPNCPNCEQTVSNSFRRAVRLFLVFFEVGGTRFEKPPIRDGFVCSAGLPSCVAQSINIYLLRNIKSISASAKGIALSFDDNHKGSAK